MLMLLKMKQLISFATARYDLWEQCVDDFTDSDKQAKKHRVIHSEFVKQLITTVQQTINQHIE